MRKTSALKKKNQQPKSRAANHDHDWRAYITFRCQCGSTHRDRVFVGRDGSLFITHHDA
jgi:hypothetical protein